MRRFVVENGLGLALLGLFLLTLGGNALSGFGADREDRRAHGQPETTFVAYLSSAHFLESLSENWESEFLQMGAYVWLTAVLKQKGSAESKPLHDEDDSRKNEMKLHPWAPKILRRGRVWRGLYARSLTIALFALFAASFVAHAITGNAKHNEEARLHGQPETSALGYMKTSTFWFESMQNWQSEFLSVLTIALLSIWLRQKGSPESKPVNAPHGVTGEEV